MRRALTAGTVTPLYCEDEESLRAAKLAWRETLNRDAALTVSAHRVATYFCEVATVDGIFPGQARMALELGVCERSIRDGVAALKERGWIVTARMGSGRSNRYVLATNSVLAAAIKLRRKQAKETIAQARFERRSHFSDRQRFAGVTGIDLPVQTGSNLPLMTGRDLPPIPLREIPCSDPLQENPSTRGNREDKHDPIAAHCTVKASQAEIESSQKLRAIAAVSSAANATTKRTLLDDDEIDEDAATRMAAEAKLVRMLGDGDTDAGRFRASRIDPRLLDNWSSRIHAGTLTAEHRAEISAAAKAFEVSSKERAS
jgi:hypothetical protein